MTTSTHTSELRRTLQRIAQQLAHLVPAEDADLSTEQRLQLATEGEQILTQATQALQDQIAIEHGRHEAAEASQP